MKETIWGYWLIILGISIITLMMLLQNYTIVNQEDYYLLKEVTQAALYDAIDYNYYYEYGELKINREVFVEMFERRFANNVKNNKTYKTDFYEIYESPPKVSVRVSTSTSSFNISNSISDFDITNDIDVILEKNSNNIFTTDFYTLTYLSCNEGNQDAMGYCGYMNSFALNGNHFKSKASNDLNNKYGISVANTNFEIISIEYVKNMSTQEDFTKYKDNYTATYNIDYNTVDSRISDSEIINQSYFAKEIKDVTILTNNDEQFAYSLKYKCPDTIRTFTLANGNVVTDSCLIGLQYKIKFRYIP